MTIPVRRTQQIARHFTSSRMNRSSIPTAPWRATLIHHLEGMDMPVMSLSTLHHEQNASTAPSGQWTAETAAFSPRARTVVYRGMWADQKLDPRNPAPRNPNVYQTDLLTLTTDVRMEKVSEIFPRSTAATPNTSETLQSCVGGVVEAVIWAAHVKTQWRIRGRVYMVGLDIQSDAAQPVRDALSAWMRRQHSGNTMDGLEAEAETWCWDKELTLSFGSLNPSMRGSFRNPPPGTPISQAPAPGLGLGQKVDDLHDEIARKNFRVLVIAPEQVDQVDLNDPERARRWIHNLKANGDEATWITTEVWP
ncbi:hypothetical protein NLG97_g5757 [Lecanicillium saksenae]|uniref:Uncharacterized protein n=1 Tax=Lecanicillium saksenae TaxID=468837 RepID=A0ACC1QS45_9HYPO|nr:hypothetical protein NLG97_g5757 [Lecanicillium saksenae]